jgi:hypothetical protein
MKRLLNFLLIATFLTLSLEAGAFFEQGQTYVCHTPASQYDLKIHADRIVFFHAHEPARAPASSSPILVRRDFQDKMIRVARFEGQRYRIELERDGDDQAQGLRGLVIRRSAAGHETSSPVRCQRS